MRLLLDTHVFIWAVANPDRLPDAVRELVADPVNEVLVSMASAWEIAIKQSLNRLDFATVTPALLAHFGFKLHTVDLRHTAEVAVLPQIHGDPFDRMLVAQARVDDLIVVTGDQKVAAYDVSRTW